MHVALNLEPSQLVSDQAVTSIRVKQKEALVKCCLKNMMSVVNLCVHLTSTTLYVCTKLTWHLHLVNHLEGSVETTAKLLLLICTCDMFAIL